MYVFQPFCRGVELSTLSVLLTLDPPAAILREISRWYGRGRQGIEWSSIGVRSWGSSNDWRTEYSTEMHVPIYIRELLPLRIPRILRILSLRIRELPHNDTFQLAYRLQSHTDGSRLCCQSAKSCSEISESRVHNNFFSHPSVSS